MVSIRQLGRHVTPFLPSWAEWALKGLYLKLYHRCYLPLTYAREIKTDPAVREEYGIDVTPPPHLRHRVCGMPGLRAYLQGGRNTVGTIRAALSKHNVDMSAPGPVLDFGCGCGRLAIWWTRDFPGHAYFGLDIDADAIAWNCENLPAGTFAVNAPLPPTQFDAGFFGLVITVSVFTHVDEAFQTAWLRELQRLTRPGGIVLATVHSEKLNKNLSPAWQREIEDNGIGFFRQDIMPRNFPKFYQATFHTRAYVDSYWSDFFEIVDHIEMGFHDLVVMRKS
jgi:SAM-dependent methyltransferase